MTPRSIRRAAERRAEKEARRQANSAATPTAAFVLTASPAPIPARIPTPGLSTGPRTEEGKRISSLNAIKTGLTGRTVLLSSDDAEAYGAHIAAYAAEYQPQGLRETELVQSLADTQWRLARIPCLESALYARGRAEFADEHAAHPAATRSQLIELDVHLKYEKQFRNLQLQESRLLRRYNKEMAELRALQAARQPKPQPTKTQAPARQEFVFSNSDSASDQRPPSSCSDLFQPASRDLIDGRANTLLSSDVENN